MKATLAEAVVSALWLGKLPIASGTWGTLGAVAVHALIVALTGVGTPINPFILPALAILSTAACIFLGSWAEWHYGKKDPGAVVIDELAGYFLAVSFFPCVTRQWLVALLAFFSFRLFDIIKPFPAGRSQRLPHGVGIVADDLIAGLYAAGVTALALRFVF